MKTSIALICVLGACVAVVPAATGQPEPAGRRAGEASVQVTDILDRFSKSDKPPLTSYRARRVLEASTMGGRMSASLEAWTFLDPEGTFRFDVIRQSGSGLILEHVLVAALDTEQRNRNQRETDQVELTPANYDFRVNAGADAEFVSIGLLPRRRSPMLLDGTVLVKRENGDVVRIDGSLAAQPSWWTRHVDIVRTYARIAGVRVPVEMSSAADVRIAGPSTFSMSYAYTMINGRPVKQAP